jgi:hypothetical protein
MPREAHLSEFGVKDKSGGIQAAIGGGGANARAPRFLPSPQSTNSAECLGHSPIPDRRSQQRRRARIAL